MKNNKKVIEILFTLVGTAMVTITFFVHEVKRETVKELRELIVQQRNTTLIREDIRKLANDVVGLQSRVASLRESPSAYASSGSIWMAFDGNMGARANLRASVLQYLDNTRLLAQRVDNSDSYLQRIDRLLAEGARETELEKYLGTLVDMGRTEQSINQTEKVGPQEVAELRQTTQKVEQADHDREQDFKKFEEDVGRLRTELQTQVNQTMDDVEHSYERYTALSYVMYPSGFVIGLLGKLIGIRDDDAVE